MKEEEKNQPSLSSFILHPSSFVLVLHLFSFLSSRVFDARCHDRIQFVCFPNQKSQSLAFDDLGFHK
jgi:hypothetical protein